MKRQLCIGSMVVALALTNAAYADFTFYSSTHACQGVSGDWNGSGTVSNWLIKCVYNGSGTINGIDSSGQFTLDVIADKYSGSTLCPQHVMHQLSGTCVDGVVTIKSEYGSLTGAFSTDAGSANGTLSVAPAIDVDVAIQFQR